MEHSAIMVLRENQLENVLKDNKFSKNKLIDFINEIIPKCDIGKIDYELFSKILVAINNTIVENDIVKDIGIKHYRHVFLELGYIYNEFFKVKESTKDTFTTKNMKKYNFPNIIMTDKEYKRVTIARKKDIYIGEDYNDDIYKNVYEWNVTLKNNGIDIDDLCDIDFDKVTLDDFIKESRSKIHDPIKEFIIDGNFIDIYHEGMSVDQYHKRIKNAFKLINDNDFLVSMYFD